MLNRQVNKSSEKLSKREVGQKLKKSGKWVPNTMASGYSNIKHRHVMQLGMLQVEAPQYAVGPQNATLT